MAITKVNLCGKNEEQFINGYCNECNSTCKMTDDLMIDKRIYDYAKKHHLLINSMFSSSKFKTYFENHPCLEKEPKYIQAYIKTLN